MLNKLLNGLLASALLTSATAWAQDTASAPISAPMIYTPAEGEDIDEETLGRINEFLAALTPQTGEIKINAANATLQVPPSHYFLDGPDARRVLQDAWGNPPSDETLGMIFPAGKTPFDNGVWGATVSYTDDGYVSDEEAGKINYDTLLKDLKSNTKESNAWRKENGYGSIDLVGWAESPSYDAQTNKMFWAKELAFEGAPSNSLNYDIRVLGRKGVLEMSFIAEMSQLDEILVAAPAVLQMANFDAGSTYAEYQPGTDKKAAYGIAGLVGGALIAKKLGLFAAIMVFGKKFIVLIIAGLAAMVAGLKRVLAKNKDIS